MEHFSTTLKSIMWKEFNLQGHYEWLDSPQKIVDLYNYKVHGTIGMKTSELIKMMRKTTLSS